MIQILSGMYVHDSNIIVKDITHFSLDSMDATDWTYACLNNAFEIDNANSMNIICSPDKENIDTL